MEKMKWFLAYSSSFLPDLRDGISLVDMIGKISSDVQQLHGRGGNTNIKTVVIWWLNGNIYD